MIKSRGQSADRPGSLAAIRDAAALIRPHIRRTPAITTDLDRSLVLKAESLQRTGSFKPRGAFNAILRLDTSATKGVITASSGNHAQAVALAAQAAGLRAVILIPANANPDKIAATRALGGEVITDGITFGNRDEKLAEISRRSGLTVIHPYDDWDVIHGQGTAALELVEDVTGIRAVVVPVGGGGLLSGCALAVKGLDPSIEVIGVEPETADDARQSLQARHLKRLAESPDTQADGVRTLSMGIRNFEVVVERGMVDRIVTVSETEILEGVRMAWIRCRLAVEPTGALALAAFVAAKLPTSRRLGLLISGGNFESVQVAGILGGVGRFTEPKAPGLAHRTLG